MPIFKIKDVEDIRTAYIYTVEAETKEEALEKYVGELAGLLPLDEDYICNDEVGITVIEQ